MLGLSSSNGPDVSAARCPFKERVFSEWNVWNADAVEPLLGGAACESLEQAGRLAWQNAARCIGRLKLFPIPPTLVREVALRHPRYDWFEKPGLPWCAVPVISNMLLATGDALFPCAPLNGWYMGTEIGSRDLGDEKRYDQRPVIADQLGLNMASHRSLWRDHAMRVLNEAVLHSFESDDVRLVDHHQAAAEFMQFCAAESAENRVVSADWSWIVPPMSGSATPVFHRTYPVESELPNLLIQTEPGRTAQGRQLFQQQGAWHWV